MEVSLVDLPPLLQIQLQVLPAHFSGRCFPESLFQRVQFNRETLQPYKSQAFVKFWETLHMDRFLDSADPTKKSRSKKLQRDLNLCRERCRLLTSGKVLSSFRSLGHCS